MEILKVSENVELDIKRFYLPIKIERECPRCGAEGISDLSRDYLSYPTVNGRECIPFYCDSCNDWFGVDAVLRISLELGDTKLV